MNRPTESSSYTWLMSGILPIKTLQGFLPIFLPGKRKFISSLKQACDLRPQQRNTTSIIIHVTYRNNYFNSILLKNSCISYIMMCQGKLHLPTHTPTKRIHSNHQSGPMQSSLPNQYDLQFGINSCWKLYHSVFT